LEFTITFFTPLVRGELLIWTVETLKNKNKEISKNQQKILPEDNPQYNVQVDNKCDRYSEEAAFV